MKKYEAFAMPIGTIISSFLTWEQFKTSVGIANWNNQSEWAPCDGRPIDDSVFYHVTNRDRSPDLRGLFLRGLNIFDLTETTHVDPSQADPDKRDINSSFQPDAFSSHIHQSLSGEGFVAGGGNNNYARNDAGWNVHTDTTATGGNETRPKNIAVYYYVKIN